MPRRQRNGWWRAFPALLLLVAVGAAGYETRETTLPWVYRGLDVGQPPVRTTHVMVLNGEPNTRPYVAAALYNRGYARQILVAEVGRTPAPPGYKVWLAQHEEVEAVLLRRGVPADRIRFLSPAIGNTIGEARNLAAFLQHEKDATVSVITNDFHSRRARWAIRQVAGRDANRVRYVTVPMDGFDFTNWWQVEEGFAICLTEYGKFGFYLMRYGSTRWWVLSALAIVLAAAIGQRWWRCGDRSDRVNNGDDHEER